MFRFGFVFILCVYSVLSYRMDDELKDMESLWSRSAPETPKSASPSASDCKKDIWILWDNSWSVGEKGFKKRIRPFLKRLILSPHLNVGPDGTHIGILTFSTQAQTRVLVELGEKSTQEELLTFLDALTYEDLKGDGTRTGMAFKVADEKFSKNNPDNHRPDVDDVVMVFTDGEPVRRSWENKFGDKYRSPRNGEKLLALDRANSLKRKEITVVGLAVGDQDRIDKFRDDIKTWTTSDDYYFETKPEELDSILEKLVSASCVDPGLCSCDTIIAHAYSTQGDKALISWTEPTLKCQSDLVPIVESMVVEPSVSSPAEFGVGDHTVTYTYAYLRGPKVAKQTCLIEINVKDCKCPENVNLQAMIPARENKVQMSWIVPKPNCRATLTSVSPAGAENGQGSFSVGQHSVIYNYEHNSNAGSFTLSCPVTITVKDCKCPENVNLQAMIPARENKAQMSWIVPKPNCRATLTSVSPAGAENGQGSFSVGQHSVIYNYEHNSNAGSFTLSCPVTINVKDCKCPETVHLKAMIPARENKVQMSWMIPKPNCRATLTSVSPAGAENGQGSFSIGQHSVIYNYEHDSNAGSFTLSCPVTITVKGKLCRGKAFNSGEEVCCCGTIYPREHGYECCGPDYYNTSVQKCCENANLISKEESCLYIA